MTIENYYVNDFPHDAAANMEIKLFLDKEEVKVKGKALIPLNGESRVLVFYIPNHPKTFELINLIIDNYENLKESFNSTVTASSSMFEISIGNIVNHRNTYSRQFYIYFENTLSSDYISLLEQKCTNRKLIVGLRGLDYQKFKTESMNPLAFISHDSRDKEKIARIIYNGLHKRLVPIWFDEYSLKPGDSLRESIEYGLKNTKKCVLILSNNFLNNNGWTKKEFDSIFSRELIKDEKVFIPIWSGISKSEVYEYSPSLLDRFALIWPVENNDIDEYNKKVEEIISKIHLAIIE